MSYRELNHHFDCRGTFFQRFVSWRLPLDFLSHWRGKYQYTPDHSCIIFWTFAASVRVRKSRTSDHESVLPTRPLSSPGPEELLL